MFCMETALKALYWSTLVYRYDEAAPDLTRDKPALVRIACPYVTEPPQVWAIIIQNSSKLICSLAKHLLHISSAPLNSCGPQGRRSWGAWSFLLALIWLTGHHVHQPMRRRRAAGACGRCGRGSRRARAGNAGPEPGAAVFGERSLDTKVLIAWSASMIVVSFRGTASMRNALADLQVPAPSCHCSAHLGSRGCKLSLRPHVSCSLDAVASKMCG